MYNFFRHHKHLFCAIFPVCVGLLFGLFAILNFAPSVASSESALAFALRDNSFLATPYNLSLKLWSVLFSHTLISLRFFSIFCGAISLVLLFQLFKKFFSLKIASLVILFVAFLPFFTTATQDVSGVTFYGLLILISISLVALRLFHIQKISVHTITENPVTKFTNLSLMILVLLSTIISYNFSHAPGDIRDILDPVFTLSQDYEPIVIKNTTLYQNAKMHLPNDYPLSQSLDNVSDQFWYITDEVINSNNPEFNSPLTGYQIVNQIATKNYLAVELVRVNE